MKKNLIAIAITLSLCFTLIWMTHIGANTALTLRTKGSVTVKGFAKKNITSDLGVFETAIYAKNIDLKIAYDQLAQGREMVKKFITDYEFQPGDVQVLPISVTERKKINEKGFETPELDHFIVSQSFRVQSQDVHKIQKMAAEAGNLLGQGIEVQVYTPAFLYTKLEDLKVEMIGMAAANAKERAEALSKNGKFKLGNVYDVRLGIFQITPPNSTEVSDYGINDTSSIIKEIKSTVEVNYFVR